MSTIDGTSLLNIVGAVPVGMMGVIPLAMMGFAGRSSFSSSSSEATRSFFTSLISNLRPQDGQ